jgi:hypothetical protein
MLSVAGTYENGQVVFKEGPPVQKKVKVIVTFLDEVEDEPKKQARRGGTMKGEITMTADFNAPLDDLTDFM